MSLAPSPAALARAGAMVTVDLRALADNWRYIDTLTEGAETAAVLKADAYGLGAAPVARALWEAGCRTFFVITSYSIHYTKLYDAQAPWSCRSDRPWRRRSSPGRDCPSRPSYNFV